MTAPLTRGAFRVRCNICKGERYIKATGIVRRVDDLGRIVIPKEIRRTLKIREGDPLEIHQDTLLQPRLISVHILRMRPDINGFSHGLKSVTPDTFCTSLRTGAALSNPSDGKKADTRMGICFFGDPPGIRTPDPLLKRQLLCQLS